MSKHAPKLKIENLSVVYQNLNNSLTAIKDLSFEVGNGEFVSIIGPSGCGKTTLLHTLAGLIKPTAGQILIDSLGMAGPNRRLAIVFQDATLLPWRNVWGNIAYGLESQRTTNSEKDERVNRYLKLVGLAKFAPFYPHQLSGGMKQRVNLARALSCEPEILLLDEPFAALDAQTREKMGQELSEIWQKTKKTFIFVTHQISEALFLADRIIVLSGRPGKIKRELKINFPRPRKMTLKWEKEFTAKEQYLWKLIETGREIK